MGAVAAGHCDCAVAAGHCECAVAAGHCECAVAAGHCECGVQSSCSISGGKLNDSDECFVFKKNSDSWSYKICILTT
jgi:hypothetical protein